MIERAKDLMLKVLIQGLTPTRTLWQSKLLRLPDLMLFVLVWRGGHDIGALPNDFEG